MNYEESLNRLQERMAGQAARTFDRKFVDACTYAADPGEPKTATAVMRQMESVQEQMRYARESHESLRRAGLLESAQEQQERYKREALRMEQQMRYAREADERSSRYQQMIDRAVSRFQQGLVLRPRA